MKPGKRYRLASALRGIALKEKDAELAEKKAELAEQDAALAKVKQKERKVAERNRKNAATKRLDDDHVKKVRALWLQVRRELPEAGNRLRFSRMRQLLKAENIAYPPKENFRNWLKRRIPDLF